MDTRDEDEVVEGMVSLPERLEVLAAGPLASLAEEPAPVAPELVRELQQQEQE